MAGSRPGSRDGSQAGSTGGETMDVQGGQTRKASGGVGSNILLLVVGGGFALASVVLLFLLLISSSHMTMPAMCSPLDDPVWEYKNCTYDPETKKITTSDGEGVSVSAVLQDGKRLVMRRGPADAEGESSLQFENEADPSAAYLEDGHEITPVSEWECFYRASVRVEAGDAWHINKTEEGSWAMDYCICPLTCDPAAGQNSTCEECVPRAPGCDVLPPEYDCWMDVRTRQTGWPIYDTGVGKVRFDKEMVEGNLLFSIFFWIFLVLFLGFLIALIIIAWPLLFSKQEPDGGYEQMQDSGGEAPQKGGYGEGSKWA